MAQIPDYTALGSTPTPVPSYRRPLIDESARGVDEALAGFGKTLTDAGDALHQKARADAATWASNQLTDFRVQQMQAMQEAQAKAPDDAHGFTPGVLADFDKRAGKLTEVAAENPLSQQFLGKAMPQLRAQVAESAMRWESQQRSVYRAQSVVDNATKLAPVVEADPSQRLAIGAQILSQIDASGLEPDQRSKLKSHVISELAVAGANGLARQDPRGVIEGLNDPSKADPVIASLSNAQREQLYQKANGHLGKPVYDALASGDTATAQTALDGTKDVMDPQTRFSLQRTIDAQVKEKQNNQKQDIADRFQDSMTGAEYGLHNPVTVTRAELEVLYPKDAQRHWDALQGIVAAGAKAKEYDQMTPEQINADVNSSAPTEGGPEAALKIKAYEMRARAADQSLKSRAQDPAQFAIDSGAGWKGLDFNKPDDMLAQLRSRANTQGAVSEQTGVNTPLLSKAENKQFTGWLTAQPPAERVQTLTTLRATMPNDQSYAALMKQIAPGSPLTAIAGSMMDRPQSGAIPNWFNPTYTTPSVVPTRILEGEQILTGKDEKGIASKFPMPKDTELMPQFMAAVGGSNSDLFRGRPETLESSIAALKAYYAAEASHQGVTNGVINPSIAATAARGVIGQVTQYGGSNLVVPAGMDPTKFEGTVDAAKKTALKAGGYSDSDIAAFNGGGLRELGDTLGTGRYVIVNGNGDPLKSKGLSVDTSKYALPTNDPAANPANWDKRADGSDKGQGFLGLLKRPDGKVSSEISIGVEVNGKEVEVPTMVPTLSQSQLDYLMTHPVGEGHPIPRDIVQKATDYARQRIDAGKSPFAGPNERVGLGKTIVIDLNQSSRIPNALPASEPTESRMTTVDRR